MRDSENEAHNSAFSPPLFDAEYYMSEYPDVPRGAGASAEHYRQYGGFEGRQPNPWFDSAWYLNAYQDVAQSGRNPLEHYFTDGASELRRPHPRFDPEFYIELNPDSAENPLIHFLNCGLALEHPTERRLAAEAYMPSRLNSLPRPEHVVVDVIVPVYKGLEETQRCINSVLADPMRPLGRVVVVNDCSPEPALSEWLLKQAEVGLIELLVNDVNQGFVRSVNAGMRAAAGRDVVLLNSDTEVPLGWLDRLVRHAYADRRIASVTPMSNNATICSYPSVAGGALPLGLTVETIDEATFRANRSRSVDIPTAVGFCMYIRRDCLDEIGEFDAETFGRGYGEENDFCLRALDAGWRHHLACDIFVYHAGEVSFGPNSPERALAWDLLVARYPRYPELIASHVRADPAGPARFALSAALFEQCEQPVFLFITHAHGGGTERHVEGLLQALDGRVLSLVLRPRGERLVLTIGSMKGHSEAEFALDQVTDLIALLRRFCVTRAHIHHVADFPVSVRRLIEELSVPFDYTMHDYLAVCPQVILLPSPNDLTLDLPDTTVCNRCISNRPSFGAQDIHTWRLTHAWLLQQAERVLCPSQDVVTRLARLGFSGNTVHAPHEPNSQSSWVVRHPPLSSDEPLRVAILGVLAAHKGYRALEASLREMSDEEIQFILIGRFETPPPLEVQLRVIETGQYCDADLSSLLAKYAPHLVWFPGQCPETYSYTLSAVLEAQLPILTSDIGALAERVIGRPWTLRIGPSLRAAPWVAAFDQMRRALRSGCWPDAGLSRPTVPDYYATQYLSPRDEGRAHRPRVLLLADAFGNGRVTPCGYIRLVLPWDDLAAEGGADVEMVSMQEAMFARGDVLVCQRQVGRTLAEVDALIESCRSRGVRLLYDLDDELLEPDEQHPEIATLMARAPLVRRMVDAADKITVSTGQLRDRLAELGVTAALIPNALDERVWGFKPKPKGPDEPVRVLYMGTATHDADFAFIRPVFETLKGEFGDALEFEVIGVASQDLGASVTRVMPPASNYPNFARWLTEQGRWTIGVAPLLGGAFNDAKSDLKLLDYAALGLAGLASDVPAYRRDFAAQGGALLVKNDHTDWTNILRQLITDPDARRVVAVNGQALLSRTAMLGQTRPVRMEVLEALLAA